MKRLSHKILGMIALFGIASGAVRAAVIDLANPVDFSVSPDGIYWKFDASSGTAVTDSSGNGYAGVMTDGSDNPGVLPAPVFSSGVNVPGTSGYGNGMLVTDGKTGATTGARSLQTNPSARFNSSNYAAYDFSMVNTSFTTGLWVNMALTTNVTVGSYSDMQLIGSGRAFTTNAHWTMGLAKSSSEVWSIFFDVGDGSTRSFVQKNIGFNPMGDGWNHFGLSFDNATKEVIFYINGLSIGNAFTTVSAGDPGIGPDTYLNKTFRIGETVVSPYSGVGFEGSFDDAFVTSGVNSFSAVPEPTIAGMVLFGLGAAFMVRRRLLR